jgi:hypothetical protein
VDGHDVLPRRKRFAPTQRLLARLTRIRNQLSKLHHSRTTTFTPYRPMNAHPSKNCPASCQMRRSGQSFPVQREQTAPCLLGLRLVVDLRIRRAPAVRGASVDLDFRGQVRLGERLFRTFFSLGDRVSSLAAIAMRNCALVLEAWRCGLFGASVTSPPPWHEATAPTQSGTAVAVRNAIGHPCNNPGCRSFDFLQPS